MKMYHARNGDVTRQEWRCDSSVIHMLTRNGDVHTLHNVCAVHRGCAVNRGVFSTPVDIMSTVGDVMSTLGVFSTLGDIMSTPGNIMINVGEGH